MKTSPPYGAVRVSGCIPAPDLPETTPEEISAGSEPGSLVHDDVRPRVQAHDLRGRHHRLRVLLVEELEAAPESLALRGEALVLGDLERLTPEAVDVEDVGQALARLELGLRDHVVGELVHEQQLLRQLVPRHQLVEPCGRRVDLAWADVADHLPGYLTRVHPPFRVQGEAHIRLLEPLAQPLGL